MLFCGFSSVTSERGWIICGLSAVVSFTFDGPLSVIFHNAIEILPHISNLFFIVGSYFSIALTRPMIPVEYISSVFA